MDKYESSLQVLERLFLHNNEEDENMYILVCG